METIAFTPAHVYATGADVPTNLQVSRCATHGAFAWKGAPSSDMRCPVCLGRLSTTTRRLRAPFAVVNAEDTARAALHGARANYAKALQTLRDLDAADATREDLLAAVAASREVSDQARKAYNAVADAAFDSLGADADFSVRMAALRAAQTSPEGARLYAAQNAASAATHNEWRALEAFDKARKAQASIRRYDKRLGA
jgi:hypothetical protein